MDQSFRRMKLSDLNPTVVDSIFNRIQSERSKPPAGCSMTSGVNAIETNTVNPMDLTMTISFKNGLSIPNADVNPFSSPSLTVIPPSPKASSQPSN
ncbi:hypothetical protein M3Y96_00547900 [Aphelenchoides besseyi]|nr:hypothetical protein M3Y96_00547900 [Aphelenchoides besseyi]